MANVIWQLIVKIEEMVEIIESRYAEKRPHPTVN